MEEFFLAMKLVFSVVVVGILSWILSVYGNLWHESQRVRKRLQMQGIKGPPPSFLHWNLPNMQRIQSQTKADSTCNSNHSDQFLAHDYTTTLFPYFEHWRKQYGSYDGAPVLALKLSSALLFSAATGMLLATNKIQPSQLAEEQRNVARLFKQLQTQIQIEIAIGNPSEGDVRDAIEKFPAKFEAARWWPESRLSSNDKDKIMEIKNNNNNGWNVELEEEMREVIEVLKRKDVEDYERLGNIALKINKGFAVSAPLLTGIAALGSVFLGDGLVLALAGVLAMVVNAFEHGGQVGMVFEMYKTCGGFFQLLEETIEAAIEEKDLDKRENGELFEMKMALQLGSVSQLRELATKSASCRIEGREIHEFANKLF
ncbi:hypothetical protein JHK82_047969 [Glycine max]|nr:hypothetical protein JHK82_047969 [Glycine max]